MKIVVTPSVTTSAEGRTESAERRTQSAESNPAWYDGKNTVYVDENADRARVFSGLLGHKMFKSGKARRIMMQVYNKLDKAKRNRIVEAYAADSEKRGFDKKRIKEVNREEVAAAYAEEIFNSPDVWEFVLSEEASLADRTLKFFEKAEKRYSFAEGMPKATRKWLAKYKMLFDQVATYNKGRSAAENATPSDMVKKLSMDERIKLFKERIATIFYLGAVELKTDVKKIRIRGDRFTAQKNLFGDKQGESGEYEAKINSLYDLADILATATYDPTATNKEPSYNNQNVKPKNAAHKSVKYWYKFRNKIVFDGVSYEVTFNIRDKGKDQYQYLIDFKEDKTPGLSNTVVNNLLRADQASYSISIPDSEGKSNSFDKKTSKDFKNSAENDKNVDDGSRSALKKSDKEYRDEVKAKADEKIAKATAKAEAKYEKKTETAKARLLRDSIYLMAFFKMLIINCERVEKQLITVFLEAKSTECEQTKPSIRGAGMRHTNGRYKVRSEAQVNANSRLLNKTTFSNVYKIKSHAFA